MWSGDIVKEFVSSDNKIKSYFVGFFPQRRRSFPLGFRSNPSILETLGTK